MIMQMRKLSRDEEQLTYDNSMEGWTPTLISISSRPDWVEEARTQRWACRDAPTRDPTRRRWSDCLLPDSLFWKRGLISEDLNELDPCCVQ